MTQFQTSRIVWMAVLAVAAGLLAATAVAAPAAAATSYTITDLGSLGLGVSDGYAINANGLVAGGSYLSTTYTTTCPPDYPSPKKCTHHPEHAFLYSNGQMTDLGALGGNNSVGQAINLSGQVAGGADTNKGVQNAALWNGKKTVDLGALAPLSSATTSFAAGINDSGQVVGLYGTNASQAFLYSNGTITDLPQPSFTGGLGCGADAINNTGQIAGVCWPSTDTAELVLWQNGTVTDLGTLGTPGTVIFPEAMSINSNGQIVAWIQTSTGAPDGFLYSNGTLTDLGTFAATAINDNGVIVGGPTIDSGGTMQNLNTLIPAGSPYQIQNATAINNNGQIVANATYIPTGQTHALLLTPA
jgi:probable HAF family extracellular repeat protein